MSQPKFAAPVEMLLASMTLEVVLWRFLVRKSSTAAAFWLVCVNELKLGRRPRARR
jgi:hypothetical protein